LKTLIRHKTLFAIGLTLVALITWMILLYQPTRRQIKATRAQVALLDQDVNTARLFLMNSAQVLEKQNWSGQRRDLLTNLCRVDSLETFVDRLAADFSRFGVSHAEFAPDLNELLKETRIPFGGIMLTGGKFQVRCQGRFLSLGKALEFLEQQPYFVDLYSMNISYNETTNPEVLCTMNFAVYLREREASHD
jgi:hypothetical protein